MSEISALLFEDFICAHFFKVKSNHIFSRSKPLSPYLTISSPTLCDHLQNVLILLDAVFMNMGERIIYDVYFKYLDLSHTLRERFKLPKCMYTNYRLYVEINSLSNRKKNHKTQIPVSGKSLECQI